MPLSPPDVLDKLHPVPRIPSSPIRVILDVVAFAGVVVCIVFTVVSWGALPEQVPHHFDWSGMPDAWGGRWALVFLCVVAAGMDVLLSAAPLFPHQFRPAGWLTKQNEARQYPIALSMLAWLKAEIVWMFALIVLTTVRVALGKAEGLGVLFLPGAFAVVGATVVVHLVMSYRRR